MAPTSFEERLARIQESRGGPAETAPAPQAAPKPRTEHLLPKAPLADSWIKSMFTGFISALSALGTVIKVGIACLAAMAYIMMPDESGIANTMMQAADDEVNGRWSVQRLLAGGDGGADIAMHVAVRQAEKRLASGELTADQATKTRAFVENRKGKSMADMMRGPMMRMLIRDAEDLGQPYLATEIKRTMNACKTANCLSVQEAKYRNKLDILRKKAPRQ